MCLSACMLALEWKGRALMEKVNSKWFCWFPAAILVNQNCPPIWPLHTKLYKDTWNVSANNSETVGHKDLRFGKIVYILVFYNTSFFKKRSNSIQSYARLDTSTKHISNILAEVVRTTSLSGRILWWQVTPQAARSHCGHLITYVRKKNKSQSYNL